MEKAKLDLYTGYLNYNNRFATAAIGLSAELEGYAAKA